MRKEQASELGHRKLGLVLNEHGEYANMSKQVPLGGRGFNLRNMSISRVNTCPQIDAESPSHGAENP